MDKEFFFPRRLTKIATTLPPVDPKDKIKDHDGFIPYRTVIIVPKPPTQGFVWSTNYGRLLARPPGPETTAQHPKQVSFTVITYHASGGAASEQEYVYIGDWRLLKQSHQNHYIRIQDLVTRLDRGCLKQYEDDWEKAGANIRPFPVWNQFGTVNVQGNWSRYFDELLTPWQGDKQFIKFFGIADPRMLFCGYISDVQFRICISRGISQERTLVGCVTVFRQKDGRYRSWVQS